MKILHLADIHLNAKFHSKSLNMKNYYKNMRKEALIKAFHYAMSHDVKVIIIAGDFLDHSNLDYVYEKFLIKEFSKVLTSGISVFYTPGNHDPSSELNWTRDLEKFTNFYMFSNDFPEIKTLMDEVGNRKINFVGCGHLVKNESRNLVALYPVKDDDDIWIGIAHTSVVGHKESEAKAKYMPTTLETLKQKKYDYFALGHIHKRQFLADNIAYSGSIEPLDISEVGPRGGIEIEVLKNHLNFNLVNFNISTMVQRSMNIDGIDTFYDLEKFILDSFLNEGWQANSTVLRIFLKGRSSLYHDLKNVEILSVLENQIRETLDVLALEIEVSDVHVAFDIERLKKDDTILSQVLMLLGENEPDEDLLKIIPGVSTSEKKDWWQKNTAQLEDEIVSRLLRTDYED